MNSHQTTAVAITGSRHTRAARRGPVTPGARGVSALMYACQQGEVDRVRKILKEQVCRIFHIYILLYFVALISYINYIYCNKSKYVGLSFAVSTSIYCQV